MKGGEITYDGVEIGPGLCCSRPVATEMRGGDLGSGQSMAQAQGAWDPGLERPSSFTDGCKRGYQPPKGYSSKEDPKEIQAEASEKQNHSLSSCAHPPPPFSNLCLHDPVEGRTPRRAGAQPRAGLCCPRAPAHTLVCWDPEDALLPGWLRPEGAGLAAGPLLLRWPLLWLLWAGSSVSLSFSCSSFRKKSTNRLFSLLIWSLMSVGMSGIIQSTRTLRNITRFWGRWGRGERRGPSWRVLPPGGWGVVMTQTQNWGQGALGSSGSSADLSHQMSIMVPWGPQEKVEQ